MSKKEEKFCIQDMKEHVERSGFAVEEVAKKIKECLPSADSRFWKETPTKGAGSLITFKVLEQGVDNGLWFGIGESGLFGGQILNFPFMKKFGNNFEKCAYRNDIYIGLSKNASENAILLYDELQDIVKEKGKLMTIK
ncbi:MAG: hypothetical protein FWC11_04770 [Firmicutes bacterium]|nr:hypothetical protein [Bacillota bacterium]MCL2256155.1 hypothetical protein [Bacillota bacterium]